ncbi:MAG: peptidoglycan bridge formation protein FemAB, partial [Treponema sp.]|nr:peptidoglycan bridge formation protein FemAB [Treponema sp.]
MRFIRGVEPAALESCNSAGSFLQSGVWGSFKARFGWNARSFLIDWEGGGKQPLLLIRRRLALTFSFAYVPWGPAFDPAGEPPGGGSGGPGAQKARSEALGELARALRPFMPGDTAFVRFDPPWYNEGPPQNLTLPLIRAGADIQPPDTVLLDLTHSWEDILSGMKSKWRYNARL